ncbi:MAG: hypothetical protein AB8B87_24750 [Granulosicoccus sp.]
MSIFDTLAENRYQQWLVEKSKPTYKAPDPVSRTRSRTSFEAQLYQQTLDLIESAAKLKADIHHDEKTLNARLAQADERQFQLYVSLEKRNLPLVAATLTQSLNQRKRALGL